MKSDPEAVKALKAAAFKIWRAKNPTYNRDYKRKAALANPEGATAKLKAWRLDNREHLLAYGKAVYANRKAMDPEGLLVEAKAKYAANSAYFKAHAKAWAEANPEVVSAKDRAWRAANPERVLASRIKNRAKEKADPMKRVIATLRSRMKECIRRGAMMQKADRSMALIGCTPSELRQHLEKQFQLGMTWENRADWHVDHIRPIYTFVDLNRSEQQRQCFHYTNLRPLWKVQNLRRKRPKCWLKAFLGQIIIEPGMRPAGLL